MEGGTEEGGVARAPIRGVGVDREGRCAHWRSALDVVAFRFPCCEGWWACHDCHEAEADHRAVPWPGDRGDERAVLCGACRGALTIDAYRDSPDACPRCGARFNPRCVLHHPRYFADAAPNAGGGG